MPPISVGMCTVPLAGTFAPQRPTHDPLEAIVLAVDAPAGPAALIALDLGFLSLTVARRVREGIARRTGLAVERIVTHCTHTHTAPWSPEIRAFGPEPLAEQLAAAVRQALAQAAPAEMAFVAIDTGGRFNVNRRKVMPAGLGALCVHMGARHHDGVADFAQVNHPRLRHILGAAYERAGLPETMVYDGPTDGELQGLFFRRAGDGQAIGALLRFAAHPTAAGHTGARKQYSADIAGVVRRHLAWAFGGQCAYLSGPCGNLLMDERGQWPDIQLDPEDLSFGSFNVPWLKQSDPWGCWRELARQGEQLWSTLLPQLPKAGDFAAVAEFDFSCSQAWLGLRPDLEPDLEAAQAKAQALLERVRALRRDHAADPAQIKRLADQVCFYGNHRGLFDWYDLGEHLPAGGLAVDVPLFRLNELYLMGLPGEAFWESAQGPKQAALQQGRRLMSFTEANGDVGYLPTEAQRPLGDFEVYSCVVAQCAVGRMEAAARAAVERMGTA